MPGEGKRTSVFGDIGCSICASDEEENQVKLQEILGASSVATVTERSAASLEETPFLPVFDELTDSSLPHVVLVFESRTPDIRKVVVQNVIAALQGEQTMQEAGRRIGEMLRAEAEDFVDPVPAIHAVALTDEVGLPGDLRIGCGQRIRRLQMRVERGAEISEQGGEVLRVLGAALALCSPDVVYQNVPLPLPEAGTRWRSSSSGKAFAICTCTGLRIRPRWR